MVDLQSKAVDVDEIQGTIEEIAKDKARRAADVVWFVPILDTSEQSARVLGFGM